ncbi:MAG: methionyl-tRNA formyltransferase [Roseiarcus sp.]|jgi:methionyl-tRNA formyltransferase
MRAAMRVIFMGASEFAAPSLSALVELGHDVVAVYTRAPKPAGRRGLEIAKTPVHRLAEACSLPVVTTATLRTLEAQAQFRAFDADVAVVAAYGLILPPPILAAPKFGCLNIHASLLPRWRGAAPVQRAIMAGDAETGVDLMRLEEGLDTGPVAREARTPIRASDTAGDLTAILAALGARLIAEALPDLAAGRLNFRPQSAEGATYARKIEKSEAPIDWTVDAAHARNHIHGLSPSPGAYGEIDCGGRTERIKILRAAVVGLSGPPGAVLDAEMTVACGMGALRIIEAQRAGKSAMSGAELMRGGKIAPGARFNSSATSPSAR